MKLKPARVILHGQRSKEQKHYIIIIMFIIIIIIVICHMSLKPARVISHGQRSKEQKQYIIIMVIIIIIIIIGNHYHHIRTTVRDCNRYADGCQKSVAVLAQEGCQPFIAATLLLKTMKSFKNAKTMFTLKFVYRAKSLQNMKLAFGLKLLQKAIRLLKEKQRRLVRRTGLRLLLATQKKVRFERKWKHMMKLEA
jgi:hypothetical protein